MGWNKVKIGSFLKERTDRFKPIDANKMGLKRIEKIDFSGTYHLVEKTTNTDMILVRKGDLLISGINAEKGAVTVYDNDEDALATIHYSSYSFDKKKMDIEYFRWFLISDAFKNLLKESAGGGIKTELKSKHLLPLEILLPELEEQKKIIEEIKRKHQKVSEIKSVIETQQTHLQQLRQAILQEAVQGKQTKQNKDDEPASKLLQRIKAEKQKLIAAGKLKKEKELPPITAGEIPFELPKRWVWCKINDLLWDEKNDIRTGPFGSALNKSEHKDVGVPVLGIESISKQGEFTGINKIFITDEKAKKLQSFNVKGGDLILSRSGTIGELCVLPEDIIPSLISTNLLKISLCNKIINSTFFCHIIKGSKHITDSLTELCGGTTRLFLTQAILKKLIFPLPPLSEQHRIVAKVQQLLQMVNQLEQQVAHSQAQAGNLLQAVLKEAFTNKSTVYAENEMITMAAEE